MPSQSEQTLATAAELKLLREVKKGAPLTVARLLELKRVFGKAEVLADRIGLRGAQRSSYFRALAAIVLLSKRPISTWRKSEWMLAAEYGARPALSPIGLLAWLYYKTCLFHELRHAKRFFYSYPFCKHIFGSEQVDAVITTIRTHLISIGFSEKALKAHDARTVICDLMLMVRSTDLRLLKPEHFAELKQHGRYSTHRTKWRSAIATTLKSLGLIDFEFTLARRKRDPEEYLGRATVDPSWLALLEKWDSLSTATVNTRKVRFSTMLGVGRWLKAKHPDVKRPSDFTPALAAELTKAIHEWKIGQYMASKPRNLRNSILGKTLAPKTIASRIIDVRAFFREVEDLGLSKLQFSWKRTIRVAKPLLNQLGPNPRIIDPAIWAKLIWAGLNLKPDQMSRHLPFEYQKAVAITWLFSGLRSDELRRLSIGCVKRESQINIDLISPSPTAPAIAYLRVPVGKRKGEFDKPVDAVIADAIEAWERIRPKQFTKEDARTGQPTHYLFTYRGKQIGQSYINQIIIPRLCAIAGVPRSDTLGPITSHRARSTMATHLRRGKTPMPLVMLAEWLGHNGTASVGHYEMTSLQDMRDSFIASGHLGRSMRTIEVLINRDVVRRGTDNTSSWWKLYNLGHGDYCGSEFWSECPHRMACVKCESFVPGDDANLVLATSQGLLERMLEEVELTDTEESELKRDLAAIADRRAKLSLQ